MAILFGIISILVFIIFLVLSLLLSAWKPYTAYMRQIKQRQRLRYYAIQLSKLVISFIILWVISTLMNKS